MIVVFRAQGPGTGLEKKHPARGHVSSPYRSTNRNVSKTRAPYCTPPWSTNTMTAASSIDMAPLTKRASKHAGHRETGPEPGGPLV